AIFQAYNGWLRSKAFSAFDNTLRHTTATVAHIQLMIGIWLYTISPIIAYFLKNFKEAVHIREFRFFGMEHSTMMLVAVILITIGSAKAKRKKEARDKYRTMAIWYSIALMIILSSIPWGISLTVSRPSFRPF